MENKLTVTINKTELPIKEYQGQRVVTMKEIDAVHQRPEGTADRNFRANEKRFIEGTDFFKVSKSQSDEIRGLEIPNRGLTLITESGYLMLVKSFTDDLAWAVQRQLVNTYFRAHGDRGDTPKLPALSSVNGAMKMALQAMDEAGVDPAYKLLALRDAYAPYGLNIHTGGLEMPEKLYDLTGMAEILGVLSARSGKPHAKAIGAILGHIGVMPHEVKIVPFTNNGHSGTCEQYTEPVLSRARDWLDARGWPVVIEGPDGTNYKVRYE